MDDRQYHLHDGTESILALLQDLERSILRAALNGGMYPETRKDFEVKLDWIKDKLKDIPDRRK